MTAITGPALASQIEDLIKDPSTRGQGTLPSTLGSVSMRGGNNGPGQAGPASSGPSIGSPGPGK